MLQISSPYAQLVLLLLHRVNALATDAFYCILTSISRRHLVDDWVFHPQDLVLVHQFALTFRNTSLLHLFNQVLPLIHQVFEQLGPRMITKSRGQKHFPRRLAVVDIVEWESLRFGVPCTFYQLIHDNERLWVQWFYLRLNLALDVEVLLIVQASALRVWTSFKGTWVQDHEPLA